MGWNGGASGSAAVWVARTWRVDMGWRTDMHVSAHVALSVLTRRKLCQVFIAVRMITHGAFVTIISCAQSPVTATSLRTAVCPECVTPSCEKPAALRNHRMLGAQVERLGAPGTIGATKCRAGLPVTPRSVEASTLYAVIDWVPMLCMREPLL